MYIKMFFLDSSIKIFINKVKYVLNYLKKYRINWYLGKIKIVFTYYVNLSNQNIILDTLNKQY